MRETIIIMLLVIMMSVTACQKKEETLQGDVDSVETVETVKQEAQELVINSPETTFTFVDVEGNYYEAPLLENVEKHSYDFTRLIEEEGKKYYTDTQGIPVSRLGIDVSEYQSAVDWQKVKEAGVSFVIVRLGYRGYGEQGTLVEDSMFRSHIEQALAAGLDVGVYFFSQAINDEEIRQEAAFVMERIATYPITCPVVFDTEEIKYDTARTDTLSKEQFTRNCELFCDILETAGYDTMIYANMKWFAFTLDMEKLTKYKKWYADYEAVPQCPYAFSMWQYTETGQIPGIEGNVDLNVWFPEE